MPRIRPVLPQMVDGHVYLIPRLFPLNEVHNIHKYGCLYDLCRYLDKNQVNTTGVMSNYVVIESDARKAYPAGSIWSTSPRKVSVLPQSRIVYKSIDVTSYFASKIQKWYSKIRRDRAAKFIANSLFERMIIPEGWLYRQAKKSWLSHL